MLPRAFITDNISFPHRLTAITTDNATITTALL